MSERDEKIVPVVVSAGPTRLEAMLCVTSAIALVACAWLALYAHGLSSRLDLLRENTRVQMSKIGDQISQTADSASQRADTLQKQSEASAATLAQMEKDELRKSSSVMTARLTAQEKARQEAQRQVDSALDELKQANSSATSKIDAINGDVSSVRNDVASTQTDVQATSAELKRVTGDLGVMSGLIATNTKELSTLRELGQRDYYEFDLKRTGGMQKIGGIQIALARVDTKRNRYTVDVLADDKRVEKRDKTINEPVQLYVSGNKQPVEIVVNQVKKDEIVGYLASPKVKATRP